jgi:hypothetical protein
MKCLTVFLLSTLFLVSCSNEHKNKQVQKTNTTGNNTPISTKKDTSKVVQIENEPKNEELNLPFVGKRLFNFGGGFPRFCQFISIDANGVTEIGSAIPEFAMFGDEEQDIEYKGSYKSILKTKYNIYKIEKNKIFLVDENGKTRNCSDGNGNSFLCVSDLTPM